MKANGKNSLRRVSKRSDIQAIGLDKGLVHVARRGISSQFESFEFPRLNSLREMTEISFDEDGYFHLILFDHRRVFSVDARLF